jgi:hypothetical protein
MNIMADLTEAMVEQSIRLGGIQKLTPPMTVQIIIMTQPKKLT